MKTRLDGSALRYVETLKSSEQKCYYELVGKLKSRFVEEPNSAVELMKLDGLKQAGLSITEFKELVVETLRKYIKTNSHLQSQTAEVRESYFETQSDVYFRKGLCVEIWSELNKRRTPEYFEESVTESLLIERDMKAELARQQTDRGKSRVFQVTSQGDNGDARQLE